MKYLTYLKNKNLSKNTINCYLKYSKIWINYLNDRKPNKSLFVKFLNQYRKTHSNNSTKLLYSSILSFIKFKKMHKLYFECNDIRLPSTSLKNKTIIDLNEFNKIKSSLTNISKWYEKRNWIIFVFLFTTGLRANELNQINKKNIHYNRIKIIGKGQKEREIFLNEYLISLLNTWKANRINISKQNKLLSYKQINCIIKCVSFKYFKKNINPHDLRRSFATNLLRNHVDLKTISYLLGHSNINTTSRYIFLTVDEIHKNIKNIF